MTFKITWVWESLLHPNQRETEAGVVVGTICLIKHWWVYFNLRGQHCLKKKKKTGERGNENTFKMTPPGKPLAGHRRPVLYDRDELIWAATCSLLVLKCLEVHREGWTLYPLQQQFPKQELQSSISRDQIVSPSKPWLMLGTCMYQCYALQITKSVIQPQRDTFTYCQAWVTHPQILGST